MRVKKGALSPPVIARHFVPKQSHALQGNPKLKALNPKQIPISKFKVQNRFGHLDFGYLILFSISDLGFRVWSSRDCHASPFAALGASAHRNDNLVAFSYQSSAW